MCSRIKRHTPGNGKYNLRQNTFKFKQRRCGDEQCFRRRMEDTIKDLPADAQDACVQLIYHLIAFKTGEDPKDVEAMIDF